MGRFVDLSHRLVDGMDAYLGLGTARIEAILEHSASRERYKGKAEFYLGKVDMPGNTGTYVDSPFHRYPNGDDLASLDLARIAAVPGITWRARDATGPVDVDLQPAEVRGKAVIVDTGWHRRWGSHTYYDEYGPYLSTATVDLLVEGGAALVGVDFVNVDDTDDPARPAHTRLLGAGIPLVEHLTNTDALPEDGYRFTAVPPPIVRGASFPVRAFAELGA